MNWFLKICMLVSMKRQEELLCLSNFMVRFFPYMVEMFCCIESISDWERDLARMSRMSSRYLKARDGKENLFHRCWKAFSLYIEKMSASAEEVSAPIGSPFIC